MAGLGSSYSARREAGAKALPNPAHIALAALETQLGDRFFLCTQNVDDLHERAGSRRLVHMHGELAKAHCEEDCGQPPVEDRAIYRSLAEVVLPHQQQPAAPRRSFISSFVQPSMECR